MAASSKDDWNEVLLKQLECPVCFEVCKPPIYMCINGHNVCSTCQERIAECCVCRQAKPTGRNIMAEDLSVKVLRPCDNQDQGCETRFCFKDMEEHLLGCQFGYQCMFKSSDNTNEMCFWRGSIKKLKEHGEKFHKEKFLIRKKEKRPFTWQFSLSKTYDTVALFAYDDDLFWCMMGFDVDKKVFSGYVRFVGKDATAAKYRCSFKFAKDGRELCYACEVLSLHQDVLRKNSEMLCGEIVDAFADNNYVRCDLFVYEKGDDV